ncbi:MAG: hypothetical protein JNL67_21590 [Planctomycetaceae bacterium]|nr:hypothetical protein [Planctomycetaceae bacterium]
MRENIAGVVKLVGISVILVSIWVLMIRMTPESFLDSGNIENLLSRTALFSILGIGVALVIMTSGIDLSLGSIVCLTGCFLAYFLKVDYQPYSSATVYEIQKSAATMLVDPNQLAVVESETSSNEIKPDEFGKLAAGQWIRLYQTKRSRSGMHQITSVAKQSSGRILLTISPPPARDESANDGTMIAKIAPAVPVAGFSNDAEKILQLQPKADGIPALRARDQLWLADAKGRLKEQVVRSVTMESGQQHVRSDLDSEVVPAEWFWIGLERRQFMSVPLAIVSVLGIGLGLGALHGILVTYVRLQPFVVTLCGLLIYRGWARWLSDDQSVGFGNEYTDSLTWFSLGKYEVNLPWTDPVWTLNIPYVFFVLLLVAILAALLLNWTIWGRYFLALGRNEEAARFSGIDTGSMKRLAYTLCGLLAGLCGILWAMQSGSISPSNQGSFFELYAIAAAVLGGCSLRGGEGSISGVIIGTALMQTLNNMITLLKIPNTIELVVLGGVILLGVVFDEVVRAIFGWLGRKRRA